MTDGKAVLTIEEGGEYFLASGLKDGGTGTVPPAQEETPSNGQGTTSPSTGETAATGLFVLALAALAGVAATKKGRR